MNLTQTDSDATVVKRFWRTSGDQTMIVASELADRIEEFLRLSHVLNLTLPEEHTLISLEPAEWQRWRSKAMPPSTPAPSLLVRRLDYALALLRRMVAAPAVTTTWASPRASRL